jgi:hypothetical protein
MNPNKALWEKGDFTRLSVSMRESGEALVKSIGITRVLTPPRAAQFTGSRSRTRAPSTSVSPGCKITRAPSARPEITSAY